MSKKSSICLLSIGRELLDARLFNSNAAHFASQLKRRGTPVEEIRVIDDDPLQIIYNLRELSRFSFVVVTGGLGPTLDDITAASAAKAFGVDLLESKEAEKIVRRQIAVESQAYTSTQARQAKIPATASPIDNFWGIAPGFSYKYKACLYFFLPGVPRESLPMFAKFVLPQIEKDLSLLKIEESIIWRCLGEKEVNIYHKISPILNKMKEKYKESFQFTCLIPYPSVDIRVDFLSGENCPEPEKRKEFQNSIEKEISPFIYAREEKSLAEVVLELLKKRSFTLATAESCTGGLLGKMITDLAGASQAYRGGMLCYDNRVKQECLGVSASNLQRYGAVSKEIALEMALSARNYFKSDYSISITGIAGPGGASREKPVGTVYIGIARPSGTVFEHYLIKGNREQNRSYASHLALHMLRNTLLSEI